MQSNLSQSALYFEIGRLICSRPEKGAAVSASEYLRRMYPYAQGFSPRNVRRMREYFRAYGNAPTLQQKALELGWTQNVVILEAGLSVEEQAWYLSAAAQFGWSKLTLMEKIALHTHEKKSLDKSEEACYTEGDEKPGGYSASSAFRVPQEHLPQPDGTVYDAGSEREADPVMADTGRIRCRKQRKNRNSVASVTEKETGRARNFLPGQDSTDHRTAGLGALRPLQRNGPGKPIRPAPYLPRRPSGKDSSLERLRLASGIRYSPVAYRRPRGGTAVCKRKAAGIISKK